MYWTLRAPGTRADLIAETCGYADEFVEVPRKLVSFLGHCRPNVGWHEGPAAEEIRDAGLRARVTVPSGHPNANVRRQDPPGGTPVDLGSEVRIELWTANPR